MNHNTLYIILLLVIIFLIYKNIFVIEGYTYIPNLNKKNPASYTLRHVPIKSCIEKCPQKRGNNTTCSGFISNIPINSNTNKKGNCTIYNNDSDFNINNISNMKYEIGTYLYINN
jgi:hypothetical protein